MHAYGYYSKHDSSKEYYMVWPSSSVEDAQEKFAAIKNLTVEEFNKLFTVERFYQV